MTRLCHASAEHTQSSVVFSRPPRTTAQPRYGESPPAVLATDKWNNGLVIAVGGTHGLGGAGGFDGCEGIEGTVKVVEFTPDHFGLKLVSRFLLHEFPFHQQY